MTKQMNDTDLEVKSEALLRERYERVVIPDDDGFVAEILEFPGCFADGDTAAEALARLEEVAKSWIMAALDQGQKIPKPMVAHGFSGRIALRLPRSLHQQAARMAQRDNTSLNQFLVSAIATRLGAEDIIEQIGKLSR